MKILIKGAGDLATGIALRLYHCGHRILMTEIAVPLTVRRMVAFSRAVYEGRAQVEDAEAVLADSYETAQAVMNEGTIAVMVDERADVRQKFCPDVVIDAILAKKNLGTTVTDAPLVIGVGPGFTAGEDCHCVIETKRGHTLGRVIYRGSALPNTGIPGEVGGYSLERLLRASKEGEMKALVSIGDRVSKGQVVAYTGGAPVYAAMSGMVRGMLQDGVWVKERLKIGDIDARCEREHCYTVSDKALSIGGAALEAIVRHQAVNGRYAVVVLAAGLATRFGADKLVTPVKGKPLYRHMLEKLEAFPGMERILVTNRECIAREAETTGIRTVWNGEPELGISHSIQLGIREVLRVKPKAEGILFCVCDQPGLSIAAIQHIWNLAAVRPGKIICAGHEGQYGNPVLWPSKYLEELLRLQGDKGGRELLKKYPEEIILAETKPEELKDVDKKEDLPL